MEIDENKLMSEKLKIRSSQRIILTDVMIHNKKQSILMQEDEFEKELDKDYVD